MDLQNLGNVALDMTVRDLFENMTDLGASYGSLELGDENSKFAVVIILADNAGRIQQALEKALEEVDATAN